MDGWRIVFMGTPDFAVVSLQALLDGPDRVVGVFTQQDKPVGRGMNLRPTPVKQAAMVRDIPVFQPQRLRDPEAVAALRGLDPDLVVVVAYGQILSPEVLALPRHGCVNVHASLLPRWRGAAPLHRALLAGDRESGVTTMLMDAGLDTGPMLMAAGLPLGDDMTVGDLHDRLAALGGGLLLETIAGLKDGRVQPRPQPEIGVTHAAKLTRDDERIDWRCAAVEVKRRIHALNPWPGAHARLDGHPLKLFFCRLGDGRGGDVAPGEVVAVHPDGLEVACGAGSVVVTRVQPAGKRPMAAADWLRGRPLPVGTRLE